MNEDLNQIPEEVEHTGHDYDEPPNPDMAPLSAQTEQAASSKSSPWIKRNLSYALLGVAAVGGGAFMGFRSPAHHADEFQSAQTMTTPAAGQIQMGGDPTPTASRLAPTQPVAQGQTSQPPAVVDVPNKQVAMPTAAISVASTPATAVSSSPAALAPSVSVAPQPTAIVAEPVERAPARQEARNDQEYDALVRENHQLKLRIAALRVQLNSMRTTKNSVHTAAHEAPIHEMTRQYTPNQVPIVSRVQPQLTGWVLMGVSGDNAAIRGPDGSTRMMSVGQGANGFVITRIAGSWVDTTMGRITP